MATKVKKVKKTVVTEKRSALLVPLVIILVVALVGTGVLLYYFFGGSNATVHSFPNLISENEIDENPVRYINGDGIGKLAFTTTEESVTEQGFDLLDIVSIQGKYPDFTGVSADIKSSFEKAIKILDRYITNDMTDAQKVLAIHDYLAYYVEYDYDLYVRYLSNEELTDEDDKSFEITGVFLERVAVCDGFAKAFMLMCGIEGIPAMYVRGTSSRGGTEVMHAWNKVKLDGVWYNIDTTLDKYLFVVNNNTTTPVVNHGLYLKSDSTYSLYGGYKENSAQEQVFIVSASGNVDYDYYSNRTISYLDDTSYTVNNEQELLDLFTLVKSKKKAVGAVEVKLNFYDSRERLNVESEFSSAIENAYKKVSNANFSYKAGDTAPPYAFYPDGVFVFMIYK